MFDGQQAFRHVAAQVAFGARPPGTLASASTRAYVRGHLEGLGWQVEEQPFVARTPLGPIGMTNVLARFPPGGERPPATPPGPLPGAVMLAAHYDTKLFADFEFVGANDGGSGVACLLELGRLIPAMGLEQPVVLAFLDGEEALVRWGPGDGLFGSAYLAALWQHRGVLKQLGAVLVLDIVGDKHLRMTRDVYSTAWLRQLIWRQAGELGFAQAFAGPIECIEDDHLPFLAFEVPACVMIGFGHLQGELFPPYWHTPGDTLDKVDPASLEIVGRVVEAALPEVIRVSADPPRAGLRPGARRKGADSDHTP